MTNFVSKETVQRLLKDVKQIIQHPLTDHGIHYIHDDTDMLKGYTCIVGPEDTPYFGGYYFFELVFPFDYPHNPPKATYFTNAENIRFNPNLYKQGKVCVSLLNTWRGDQWTSCQTISTVLLTLCSLLCQNPLLNEPGIYINHADVQPYNKIIEFANLRIAVCAIVSKKVGVYLPFFELFDSVVKEQFLKNLDKFISFAELKNMDFLSKPTITTSLYDMKVKIDYEEVIQNLMACRDLLLGVKSNTIISENVKNVI